MANGIVLTNAIRQNLLALQQTGDLQAKVQERLATGKKVNSALDGPTNFFTAAGLSRRASDLSTVLDGMMNGIKTLEAADKGMKGIIQTVETMRAYVRQARQDKSFKGVSYTVDPASVGTAAVKNLTVSGGAVGTVPISIALNTADIGGTRTTRETSAPYAAPIAARRATYQAAAPYGAGTGNPEVLDITFAGVTTTVNLAGSDNTVTLAVTAINTQLAAVNRTDIEAYNNGGTLQLRSTGNVDGSITVAGAGEPNVFGVQVTQAGSDGLTQFSVNGTLVTLTTAETSVSLAAEKANADLGPTSLFEAFANGTNLQFRAKSNGATPITIGGTDSGLFAAPVLGTTAGTAGTVKTVDALVAEINGHPSLVGRVKASNDGGKLHIDNLSTEALRVVGATTGAVTGLAGTSSTQSIGGNEVRKSLIAQFNELRQQLDRLAEDAGYNGVNLLKADKLKLAFNEVSTSILEIEAKDSNGVVRPINTSAASLNIVAASAAEFSDDLALEARVEKLGDALTALQTQSSAFGSSLSIVQVRQEFTKGMINTLEVGADNLTLADSNEEGANLLALNTRQQLAQTTLSLAAQAQQAVLRLFG